MLRVPELEERAKNCNSLIKRLRMGIVQGDHSLLFADVSNGDEAAICSGHGDEVMATPLVSKSVVLSDAQRLRLYQQAANTLEMLQTVYDRDMKNKIEEALRVATRGNPWCAESRVTYLGVLGCSLVSLS